MSDLTIEGLSAKIDDFISARGWKKYHRPRDIAIALSVEASELLEVFQWTGNEQRIDANDMTRIRHETADVVIYALSMANACGFDLGQAIIEKIRLNEEKYPKEKSGDLFG